MGGYSVGFESARMSYMSSVKIQSCGVVCFEDVMLVAEGRRVVGRGLAEVNTEGRAFRIYSITREMVGISGR